MATNVGSIYVAVRGDTTQWQKDMASLRSSAKKSGKEVSEALNSGISSAQSSAGIRTISTGLKSLAQTAKIPEKQFKQTADAISDSFGDVANSIGMTKKDFALLNEKMLRNKAFQSATNDLRNLTRAAGLSAKETRQLAIQMGYSSKQAKEMSDKIHHVNRGATDLTGVMTKLGSVVGIVAGASGIGYLISQNLEATAELKKSADMAGVTISAYQELSYAAKQYNVTSDALTDGLKELNLRAEEFVVTGAGPGKEAFERLGYSQKQLNEGLKDTPGLLLDVIDRLQGMDKAAQMRIADEIFGGQGGEQFVSMIKGGSNAIRGFTKDLNDMGAVLSDEAAANVIKAKNAIDSLTIQLQTQFSAIIADLAPDIKNVADYMGEWVASNRTMISQKVPEYLRGVRDAISDIKTIYDALPSDIIGPASSGLVGYMLFGKTGAAIGLAANLVPAISNIVKAIDQIDKGNLTLGQFAGMNATELDAYLKNIEAATVTKPIPKRPSAVPAIDSVSGGRVPDSIKKITKEVTTLVDANLEGWFYDIDQAANNYINILEKGAQVTLNMRTPMEQLSDETANLNELLNAGAISAETYSRAIAEAQERLMGGGVDAALESFFSDIDSATEKLAEGGYWDKFLESMENNMLNMDQIVGDTIQGWTSRFGDFFESAIYDSENLGDAFSTMAQGMARTMTNAIGEMIAQWLVYKVTKTLVDKSTQTGAATAMAANAQAASMQAGINAYGSAAAIPITGFAMAPAAMAAALAATQPMAATVAALAATAAAGMAHDGIDSIPKTGSWILEKGERVTTEKTSKRLDMVLNDIQANPKRGGDSYSVSIPVNVSGGSQQLGNILSSEIEDTVVRVMRREMR